MATYEIVLRDQVVERVDGADAYEQEGQLTTFFATDGPRRVVDSWSTRLASFRTAEILAVRRLPEGVAGDGRSPSPAGTLSLAQRSA